MLRNINVRLIRCALCQVILGIALSYLFLWVLHPKAVDLLVAVAFDSHTCTTGRGYTGYLGIQPNSGELRCFYTEGGTIKSAHLKYL